MMGIVHHYVCDKCVCFGEPYCDLHQKSQHPYTDPDQHDIYFHHYVCFGELYGDLQSAPNITSVNIGYSVCE